MSDVANDQKRDLFLSYRRKDEGEGKNDFVTKLCEKLEKRLGKFIFFDKKDIKNRDDFTKKIQTAIDDCSVFIPIVTKNYIAFREKPQDDWCMEEIAYAISQKKIIVPVVCDDAIYKNDIQIGDFNWQEDDIKYEDISNEYIIKVLKTMQQNNVVARCGQIVGKIDGYVDVIIQQVLNQYIPPIIDFLQKQNSVIDNRCGLNVEYLTALDECDDFGISGKATKAERENFEKKRRDDEKEINHDEKFAHFSLKRFIESLKTERTALIVGDAGQGKSVYLKKICRYFFEQIKNNDYAQTLIFPIYIQLRKLRESYESLKGEQEILSKKEFLIVIANSVGIDVSIIEWLMRSGEVCFLFDGMDEVSPETLKSILELINRHLIINQNNTYVVFSSRPKQQFIANQLEDFNLDNVTVVRRWILDGITDNSLKSFLFNKLKNTSQNVDDLKKLTDDWFNAITRKEGENVGYKTLSRNPLTLNVILSIAKSYNSLPESKVEVYDKAVQNLLQRDKYKQPENDVAVIDDVKQILGKYAYHLYHRQDNSTEPLKDVNSTIDTSFQDDEARRIRVKNFINNRSLVDENGFSHDLFQTYYCAFYIYKLL